MQQQQEGPGSPASAAAGTTPSLAAKRETRASSAGAGEGSAAATAAGASGDGAGDHNEHSGTEGVHPAGEAYFAPVGKRLTSRFRGVCWNKKNKRWQAAINSSGRYLYLGSFTGEAEAAHAFDKAALKIRGVKTKLNFSLQEYLDAKGNIIEDEHLNHLISMHERMANTQRMAAAQAMALAGLPQGKRSGGGCFKGAALAMMQQASDPMGATAEGVGMQGVAGGASGGARGPHPLASGLDAAGGPSVLSSAALIAAGVQPGGVSDPGSLESDPAMLHGYGEAAAVAVRAASAAALDPSAFVAQMQRSGSLQGQLASGAITQRNSISISRIGSHLPPGCSLEHIMPGEGALAGVLYLSPEQQRMGAAMWDGSTWHEGGLFDTEHAARQACQFALCVGTHFVRCEAAGLVAAAAAMAGIGHPRGLTSLTHAPTPPDGGSLLHAPGSVPHPTLQGLANLTSNGSVGLGAGAPTQQHTQHAAQQQHTQQQQQPRQQQAPQHLGNGNAGPAGGAAAAALDARGAGVAGGANSSALPLLPALNPAMFGGIGLGPVSMGASLGLGSNGGGLTMSMQQALDSLAEDAGLRPGDPLHQELSIMSLAPPQSVLEPLCGPGRGGVHGPARPGGLVEIPSGLTVSSDVINSLLRGSVRSGQVLASAAAEPLQQPPPPQRSGGGAADALGDGPLGTPASRSSRRRRSSSREGRGGSGGSGGGGGGGGGGAAPIGLSSPSRHAPLFVGASMAAAAAALPEGADANEYVNALGPAAAAALAEATYAPTIDASGLAALQAKGSSSAQRTRNITGSCAGTSSARASGLSRLEAPGPLSEDALKKLNAILARLESVNDAQPNAAAGEALVGGALAAATAAAEPRAVVAAGGSDERTTAGARLSLLGCDSGDSSGQLDEILALLNRVVSDGRWEGLGVERGVRRRRSDDGRAGGQGSGGSAKRRALDDAEQHG